MNEIQQGAHRCITHSPHQFMWWYIPHVPQHGMFSKIDYAYANFIHVTLPDLRFVPSRFKTKQAGISKIKRRPYRCTYHSYVAYH